MKKFTVAVFLMLRPKQWAKNLLIFVAPFAAGISPFADFAILILGFLTFCLASSIGYIINDIRDLDIDRLHPKKKNRPFASGSIGIISGYFIAFILSLIVVTLSLMMPVLFAILILLYILNSTLYTFVLKTVPVVELFVVAIGFVLRLVAGAALLDLVISEWFLIVGGFGALFVVSEKRLAEFNRKSLQDVRKVIRMYSSEFLHGCISISVSVSITAYSFWAFSDRSEPFWFQLSIFPFVMALFRYRWISERENIEAPEDAILNDKPLLSLGAMTVIFLSLGIY